MTEEERKENVELYKSLLESSGGATNGYGAVYFAEGFWVYPDGTIIED